MPLLAPGPKVGVLTTMSEVERLVDLRKECADKSRSKWVAYMGCIDEI